MLTSLSSGENEIEWIFQNENAGLVGGLGLVSGLLGTVLTLVAFGITIWQLARTRSANQRVASAISSLKSRVAAYDVVTELARADAALKESQRHVATGNWLSVVDSVSEARVAIVRLAELPSSLEIGNRATLSAMSSRLEQASKRIRSSLSKGSKMPEQSQVLHLMSEFQIEITKVALKVERKI